MVGRFHSIMAKHKKISAEPEDEPQLDISSLIDVCFLLLIYFLVTSTIIPRERDLLMALPTDKGERPLTPAIPPMFIRVAENGAVFSGTGAGEQALDTDASTRDLPLLSSQLHLYHDAARSAGDEAMVQLSVDASATQQRVIDVLNALGGEGIVSVTFTDLVDDV